eukprot:TRINITY_DN3119_c1_g1_i1.p1 TRINITY_DN3119_c1_g1~~TRINITY_DN3119_c1_g1_i1.p1  ORF type:complete len:531 (+),score=168.71 TRINITY_DN3119_c1_g1_i1:130-1722(+)
MRIGEILDNRYEVTSRLGEGAFGAVFKAVTLDEYGFSVAVKEMDSSQMNHEEVLRELQLMWHFRDCPQIIKVFNAVPGSPTRLVLELLDIDLDRWLETTQKKIELRQVRLLLYQMLGALHWLHAAGVVHRDLKCANMLLHCNWQLKLCDLGAAKADGDDASKDCRIGTHTQRAPELLVGPWPYSEATDVWAVGVVFQRLLAVLWGGSVVLSEDSIEFEPETVLPMIHRACGMPSQEVIDRLVLPDGATPSNTGLGFECPSELLAGQYAGGYSDWEDAVRFAAETRRLQREEGGRVEAVCWAEQLGLQPRQKAGDNATSLLSALLSYDPSRRITTADALQHAFFRDAGSFLQDVAEIECTIDTGRSVQPFSVVDRVCTDGQDELRRLVEEMRVSGQSHNEFYAQRKRVTGLMMVSPMAVDARVLHEYVQRRRQRMGRSYTVSALHTLRGCSTDTLDDEDDEVACEKQFSTTSVRQKSHTLMLSRTSSNTLPSYSKEHLGSPVMPHIGRNREQRRHSAVSPSTPSTAPCADP